MFYSPAIEWLAVVVMCKVYRNIIKWLAVVVMCKVYRNITKWLAVVVMCKVYRNIIKCGDKWQQEVQIFLSIRATRSSASIYDIHSYKTMDTTSCDLHTDIRSHKNVQQPRQHNTLNFKTTLKQRGIIRRRHRDAVDSYSKCIGQGCTKYRATRFYSVAPNT